MNRFIDLIVAESLRQIDEPSIHSGSVSLLLIFIWVTGALIPAVINRLWRFLCLNCRKYVSPYVAGKINDVCNFTGFAPQTGCMLSSPLDAVNPKHILYKGLTISLKDTVNLFSFVSKSLWNYFYCFNKNV